MIFQSHLFQCLLNPSIVHLPFAKFWFRWDNVSTRFSTRERSHVLPTFYILFLAPPSFSPSWSSSPLNRYKYIAPATELRLWPIFSEKNAILKYMLVAYLFNGSNINISKHLYLASIPSISITNTKNNLFWRHK